MNPACCSRRQMIRSLAAGSLLFPGILQQLLAAESAGNDPNSVAPKAPHFTGRAKRVIFLYMSGGVSHMDSFDPKPRLFAEGGQPMNDKPGAARYVAPLW